MDRLADWLDQRLGYRNIIHGALFEPVRGGARWAYVFGSALLVLFGVQAVTGIALAAYYSPSPADAWASVNFIQSQVYLGWLLRGMHHYGAAAMVVLVGAHLLQTVWFGAFKSPRELNWLAGFLLLQLVLAFALTGYLLPWDQKGYWATQVATSIAGTVPGVGGALQTFLQGGPNYGHLTLTRFYSLHVLLLPVSLTALLALHLYLFRRHGVTVRRASPEQEVNRRTEPFFPHQFLRDTAFALAVVAGVGLLAWRGHGAPLAAPADPSSQFLARPEWYFLPLFQLLKYFEGPQEVVGTVVLPALAMALLALLPFVYIALRQITGRAHQLVTAGVVLGMTALVGLGALAAYQDRQSKTFTLMLAREREAAAKAAELARNGVPIEGPLALYKNDPVFYGERMFQQTCEQCHHACSENPYKGDVCLEGYGSRQWLARLVRDPQNPFFFGNSHIDEMDPFRGDDAKLVALVEFLYAQAGHEDVNEPLAQQGNRLFVSEGCGACHSLDRRGTGDAPDLKEYASVEWLSDFVRHPDSPRFYAGKNRMKLFKPDDLKDAELSAVVAYLRAQTQKPLNIP